MINSWSLQNNSKILILKIFKIRFYYIQLKVQHANYKVTNI